MRWLDRFASWPLALASALCIGSALSLNPDVDGSAEALFVIGAVLLGGWMALLARSGYDGGEVDDHQDRGGE
jgi:hypothetical protein